MLYSGLQKGRVSSRESVFVPEVGGVAGAGVSAGMLRYVDSRDGPMKRAGY